MKVLKSTTPVARKTHFCDYCTNPIREGEKYSYQFLAYGGEAWQFKAHLICQSFMEKMQDGEYDGWDRESFENHIIYEFRESDAREVFGELPYHLKVEAVLSEFENKNK